MEQALDLGQVHKTACLLYFRQRNNEQSIKRPPCTESFKYVFSLYYCKPNYFRIYFISQFTLSS